MNKCAHSLSKQQIEKQNELDFCLKAHSLKNSRTNVLGYIGGKLVNSVTHHIYPIPAQLIKVDKGIHYILPSKWGCLKGLSKLEASYVSGTRILNAVSSNI